MQKLLHRGALAFNLAGILTVLVIAGGGLWFMTELVTHLEESAFLEHALRNHLEADMMHDALRGDVLEAQHQNPDHRPTAGNPEATSRVFTHSFSEHVARFRRVIDKDTALEAPHYRELAAVLASLSGPITAYIDEAEKLVPLALSDPAASAEPLPEFEGRYHELETSMERASDRIEALARVARAARRLEPRPQC
jgi:methyl-accepting chemotaxis protein